MATMKNALSYDVNSRAEAITLGSAPDERTCRRFGFCTSISVRCKGSDSEHFGLTRDVSVSGAYFFLDPVEGPDILAEGAKLSFSLPLPVALTGRHGLHICCSGTITRVEKCPTGKLGIAVRVHSYSLKPSPAEMERAQSGAKRAKVKCTRRGRARVHPQ